MRDSNMKAVPNNPKGFTLIEMLMAMAAGLVVMAGIYTAFVNHQRSHVTQQMVVEMQQNARAALALMKREIRMAGYDPSEAASPSFGLGRQDEMQFEVDHNGDGVLDDFSENVTYWLDDTVLWRRSQDAAGNFQDEIVAYDIEAVGFAYAVDEDDDEVLDPDPGGFTQWIFDSNDGDFGLDQIVETVYDGVIDDGDSEGGVNKAGQAPTGSIRAVKIWLLARTRQPIKGHTDNQTYVVGADRIQPGDPGWDPRRKRVLLTTTVYCRNM